MDIFIFMYVYTDIIPVNRKGIKSRRVGIYSRNDTSDATVSSSKTLLITDRSYMCINMNKKMKKNMKKYTYINIHTNINMNINACNFLYTYTYIIIRIYTSSSISRVTSFIDRSTLLDV
jgi:hypothetical protein